MKEVVFAGGSRHVARLNSSLRERLGRIIERELPVIIGDANGADKAMQQYLHSRGYRNVEVFCSDGHCRNNVGEWTVRAVAVATRERDFRFYSAKDQEMAKAATVGFMIWDGKSIGTLVNVYRLLSHDKKVVVYTVPSKKFDELRGAAGWDAFIGCWGAELRDKVQQRAALEAPGRRSPIQTSLSF
jgi:hypothetical protein